MDGLLSRPGLHMNYIHFSAITTAAAHIWKEAQRSPRFGSHADLSKRLKTIFRRCLQSLQVLLAEVESRQISNVLWSSATLGFDPDDSVPGLVHALTLRLLYFINTGGEKQQPKAQEAANVLWAFATMGHPAATAQVVDAICLHFGRLVDSPTAQPRPDAQAVANLVWALGTLEHTPADDTLLDRLCAYMRDLLCSRDRRTHPNAQEIANTVWALGQLKHAPSHDVVIEMFDHLEVLCQTPDLQPDSQNVSNSLSACAELSLDVKPTCVEALLKHAMEMRVVYQVYCNLAWSLAVMQCLDLNTLEALLGKLTTKLMLSNGESGSQSTSAQLTTANTSQLYQALAWLRPHSASKQMKAWSSLRAKLLRVAPEPAVIKLSYSGQKMMWAALAVIDVPYQAQVQQGIYRAHAVLSPCDEGVAKVILMVDSPRDHLINLPSR